MNLATEDRVLAGICHGLSAAYQAIGDYGEAEIKAREALSHKWHLIYYSLLVDLV